MSKKSRLSGKKKSTWGGKILPALCNIAGTLIIVGVILTLLPAVIPKMLGYQIYNIETGSMAPAIPIGSIVVIDPIEPSQVVENDVIAFQRQGSDTPIVHRAISNHVVEGEFVTMGDANRVSANAIETTEETKESLPVDGMNEEEKGTDFETVPYDAYLGVVIRHVPYLGGWLAMNTTRGGKLALMAYLACGCLLNILAGKMRG